MVSDIILIDAHGKHVTNIPELPAVPVPRAIIYREQIYLMVSEGRIYQAAAFYVAGGTSHALFDAWGRLIYPEVLQSDANPFGRANYVAVRRDKLAVESDYIQGESKDGIQS